MKKKLSKFSCLDKYDLMDITRYSVLTKQELILLKFIALQSDEANIYKHTPERIAAVKWHMRASEYKFNLCWTNIAHKYEFVLKVSGHIYALNPDYFRYDYPIDVNDLKNYYNSFSRFAPKRKKYQYKYINFLFHK